MRPLYQCTEGQYFTSYIDPLSRKRVRDYFKNKPEALNHKRFIEDKFKKSRVANFKDLYIKDLIIMFIQEHPKSVFTRMRRYSVDFSETFGSYKVEELSSSLLKMWFDQIKQENNLLDITMRGIKCDIDVFFRYLIKKEIISESPLKAIYYKKTVPDIAARNILSSEQIQELLEEIKEFSPGYLYPIIKLVTETAMKPSDVVELTWQQIDLNKREVVFQKTLKSQERRLLISEEMAFLIEKKNRNTKFVFMTYYKESFTKTKIARLINEFKIKSNCKIKWTLMDLRHSFAVNYLRAGGDLKDLQKILGHEKSFDTKRLYAEATKSVNIESVKNPFDVGSYSKNLSEQGSRAAQDPGRLF